MKNYFTFDGVDSTTYNTYIATSNMFNSPEEEVEVISIPASNQVIYMSNGTFKPFIINCECYITKDMKTQVDLLRNFLQSRGKPCKYSEALKPNEYRIARYVNAFSLGESDRVSAAFELQFTARPERFLTSGDEITTFTENGTITNPTNFSSKPLLRVYGTGTLTIGNYQVVVNKVNQYVDIDCDTMQCYKGNTNCNNNVIIDEFPQLASGKNKITLVGITQVDITGRWYIL